MTAAQDKRHGQTMAILVTGLSIACIYQMFEIDKLKSQLKDQAETTEYAINALEKCSGHLSEISGKVISLREQLKPISK